MVRGLKRGRTNVTAPAASSPVRGNLDISRALPPGLRRPLPGDTVYVLMVGPDGIVEAEQTITEDRRVPAFAPPAGHEVKYRTFDTATRDKLRGRLETSLRAVAEGKLARARKGGEPR